MCSLGVLLVEHCTTVTLTRYTQQRLDVPRASPTMAVLSTEVLKMFMSIGLELSHAGGLGSGSKLSDLKEAVFGQPWDTLRLSPPSFMYTLQNNLIFVALANLEIVSFQVAYQAKLIITALLSVALLSAKLAVRQWFALLLLTAGVIAVELSDQGDTAKRVARRTNTNVGLAAALAAATLSSFAGVYFELIVKKKQADSPSLWVRNVQLGVFAIPLAALAAAWQNRGGVAAHGLAHVFRGFDTAVLLLVLFNASGGLVVAMVIKYGDNILKNFSTACSVILGTMLSVALFDFKVGLQFAWGAALVAAATVLYASAVGVAPAADVSSKQKLLEEGDGDTSASDENMPGPAVSVQGGGNKAV